MADMALHLGDHLVGVALVPVAVEAFGHGPELDDEIARQVLRLDVAAFLAPQPQQGGLVIPHDDPGVRPADEGTAIGVEVSSSVGIHGLPPGLAKGRDSGDHRAIA